MLHAQQRCSCKNLSHEAEKKEASSLNLDGATGLLDPRMFGEYRCARCNVFAMTWPFPFLNWDLISHNPRERDGLSILWNGRVPVQNV